MCERLEDLSWARGSRGFASKMRRHSSLLTTTRSKAAADGETSAARSKHILRRYIILRQKRIFNAYGNIDGCINQIYSPKVKHLYQHKYFDDNLG